MVAAKSHKDHPWAVERVPFQFQSIALIDFMSNLQTFLLLYMIYEIDNGPKPQRKYFLRNIFDLGFEIVFTFRDFYDLLNVLRTQYIAIKNGLHSCHPLENGV